MFHSDSEIAWMTCTPVVPKAKPPKGGCVHLLLTCLCDAFYPEVGIAAVECLEKAGYRVEFDERQTCCGQPAFNTGDREAARQVARHTLHVFRRAEVLVVPSGSCAAMIRWGYPQLFDGEPDRDTALALAARTYELTEFLTTVAGMSPWPGAYRKKVALHRSCHMRELGDGGPLEALLKSIQGLTLLPVPMAEQCCGFGGTFAVSFPWTSRQIGTTKLEALRSTGAQEIVSTDMGCLMHLSGLEQRAGGSGKADHPPMRHVAQLLRDSLRKES